MKLVPGLNFAVLFCFMASPLRAEWYEFEVKGQVAGGILAFYQVAVGDEITFRYSLDSTDLDPHPLVGRYGGTTAFIEFPHMTLSGDPASGGFFTVNDPFAYFLSDYPGDPVGLNFRFPPGTLSSDALPLTLPLSTASIRSFHLHPFLSFPVLFGTITSYESQPVPEPSSLWVLSIACAVLRRRRT